MKISGNLINLVAVSHDMSSDRQDILDIISILDRKTGKGRCSAQDNRTGRNHLSTSDILFILEFDDNRLNKYKGNHCRFNEFSFLIGLLESRHIRYKLVDSESEKIYDDFFRKSSFLDIIRMNLLSVFRCNLDRKSMREKCRVFYDTVIERREKEMLKRIIHEIDKSEAKSIYIVIGEFHKDAIEAGLKRYSRDIRNHRSLQRTEINNRPGRDHI